jgi:hypothetical protein
MLFTLKSLVAVWVVDNLCCFHLTLPFTSLFLDFHLFFPSQPHWYSIVHQTLLIQLLSNHFLKMQNLPRGAPAFLVECPAYRRYIEDVANGSLTLPPFQQVCPRSYYEHPVPTVSARKGSQQLINM